VVLGAFTGSSGDHFSLLPLQKFDGIRRNPLGRCTITVNNDTRIEMSAAAAVEYPPAPRCAAAACGLSAG